MIVTHLKHSYPNLIDDLRAGKGYGPDLRLEGLTRGDWPPMTTKTAMGYLDYVVGTSATHQMIVSAYPVNTLVVTPEGKTRFEYVPEDGESSPDHLASLFTSNVSAVPGEWLIGCPIPGGQWKQGESRNTRRYALETYLDDHPELLPRIGQDFGGRMALHLIEYFAGARDIDSESYPALAAAGHTALAGGTDVTVVRQPGGTVVVTIPTGTRAQILIDPS
jgi:hypothetical protein